MKTIRGESERNTLQNIARNSITVLGGVGDDWRHRLCADRRMVMGRV